MKGNSSSLPFLSRVAKISSLLRTHTHSPAFNGSIRERVLDISYNSLVFRRMATSTAEGFHRDFGASYKAPLFTMLLRTLDACVCHLTNPIAPNKAQKLDTAMVDVNNSRET